MGFSQNWERYTPEEHATWCRLYTRMQPVWERWANLQFLDGLLALHLDPFHIPRIDEVNRFLGPLTGFQATPVAGYLPAFRFFDSLRNRRFPTTVTIRNGKSLEYLPEPDIFHDIAGHVPMHTNPAFAETLVRFGRCAHTAAELAAEARSDESRLERVTSIIRAMARFFWFTIEFGLIQSPEGLKACGSGLLSSHGELAFAMESPLVQRYPIQLEWAVNQSFEIHHFQPLLFYVDSFEHLFSLVEQLERWMREGKLDHVAPGEPGLDEADLQSFLPELCALNGQPAVTTNR